MPKRTFHKTNYILKGNRQIAIKNTNPENYGSSSEKGCPTYTESVKAQATMPKGVIGSGGYPLRDGLCNFGLVNLA